MVQVAKERRHFTAEQKISILREHLLEEDTVSDVCDRHGVSPSMFYRWQKELFENGAEVLQSSRRPAKEKRLERKVEALEEKLSRKDEVIAKIMHEHVSLKKNLARTEAAVGTPRRPRRGGGLHQAVPSPHRHRARAAGGVAGHLTRQVLSVERPLWSGERAQRLDSA